MYQDPAYADNRVPDTLIAVRQFVGGLNAGLNDQAYGGQDASVWNPTGRFYSVGPYGTAIEGQPVAITQAGGVAVSPSVTMLLLGGLAVWLLTKKG